MARRPKAQWLQRTEYAAYRLIANRVRKLSDAGIARWGNRLGNAARRIIRGRDRLAMRNLRSVFPERSEDQLRHILDECWRHFGRETLESIHMQGMPKGEIAARCPTVNAEVLEDAMRSGNGTILMSGHYGGWEVGGLAITTLVPSVRTVARPLDNEYLERDLAALRASTGVEVIDRRRAARALVKALGENAVVVMLPDQAVLPREGILVPFLGRPAWTTDAPAKLALRLRSRIVFAFCIPDGPRHRLEFEEPIRIDRLSDAESNPEALTKSINEVLSRRIAARPELWLWMHDRWKGTGPGESEKQNGE